MKNIGIDTGGSFTRFWDGENEVIKHRTPGTYNAYLQLLQNVLKEYGPIQSVVIGLPAVIDGQQIVEAPNLGNDWVRRDIKADIHSLVQISGKISILQDTEVAGYAIQDQELDDMDPTMLITLSTGVGGALVTRDFVKPLEVGHIILNLSGNNLQCGCGQYGCVETDLSGTAIYKRLGVRAEYVEETEFWSNYGTELGRFLLILIVLFKLRQIILIGGVSQRAPLFLEQTRRYLNLNLKHVPVPKILVSRLRDDAGVCGAYRLATRFGV